MISVVYLVGAHAQSPRAIAPNTRGDYIAAVQTTSFSHFVSWQQVKEMSHVVFTAGFITAVYCFERGNFKFVLDFVESREDKKMGWVEKERDCVSLSFRR